VNKNSESGQGANAAAALIALVFAALVGVEIYGFRSTPLFSQTIWFPIGIQRFTRFIGEYLAFAVPLLVIVPWTFAGFIVALVTVLTAISVGPLPVLVGALFFLSSYALGSKLLGRNTSELCALLLGSGVYVFVMLLLARVPVHYPTVWLIVLAIPVLLDFRHIRERLKAWTSGIASLQLRSPGERIAFALLIFILIAHWFTAMLPEIGGDALAMHLAIPMNIVAHHRMTYEPSRILWSVMPMGADWLYSITYLLGGEYGPRMVNYGMFLVLIGLLYQASRRWLPQSGALLVAASFAATPVTQFVTGALFVENYLVALVLGMATALWQFADTGEKRFLYLAAALGGTAMTTKYAALVFIGLAIPFAIVEIVRHRKGKAAFVALLLLVVVAIPTYLIAYEKTGNPIFPFLNVKIHSPLLNPSVVIADQRFRIPIDWKSLYTLTFHTSKVYEGGDGSFGFQYLVFAPLALLGLLVARRRAAVGAVVMALAGGILILQSTPNVRYLYTAMPLLLIGIASLAGWMLANRRWLYRIVMGYLFIATALNAYFLPSSSYYHKDFCLRLPFSRAERQRYYQTAAPVRVVIDHFEHEHPGAPVLMTSSTSIAGLTGDVYVNNWHQITIADQIKAAPEPLDVMRLVQRWKIEYFIVERLPEDDETVPPQLKALIKACTKPEFEDRDYSLVHLESRCHFPGFAGPPKEVKAEDQIAVPTGTYDDYDPAISFHRVWSHDRNFAEPYGHTVSYTDTLGASVSIAFEGQSLTYVFTKAPNRGMASVIIDGSTPQTIDLYARDPAWQSAQTFCCFGPGRHSAVIAVTGQKNPKSTGTYIDLDSFVVR